MRSSRDAAFLHPPHGGSVIGRLWRGLRSGELLLRDRLAIFSVLAGAIVLSLLAVIVTEQARSLALHDRSVQGLHFGRHADRLLFALARERELAQAGAAGEANLERRQASTRREVDLAVQGLQAFVQQSEAVRQAIGDDPAMTHLPDYLRRLRARVDQAVMKEETAGHLYTQPVRQLFRLAAFVEERCIAPALGSRTNSLLSVAMLLEEFSRQASALRRIERASQGGALTQDRGIVAPLLDSSHRSDHMLSVLMAHSDADIAGHARSLANSRAHRSIREFTDKLALGAWSASFKPRWGALIEDADKMVDITQESRQQAAMSFVQIAERQAADTRRRLTVVSALGALLVGFMSAAMWLLYRSIAGPLRLIAGAAQATVDGNLSTSVAYHRRDEVGHMAHGLQVLIDTIALFNSEMLRTRESVARGELAVRADGSRFRGEWRSLIERFNDTLGEFAAMHKLFQHQAFHHPDSGLLNRMGLAHRVEAQAPAATPCNVFLLLLVRLEDLTITLGADFSAGLLRTLAGRLVARFGERYVIAQVSMREFALVSFEACSAEALEVQAGEIARAVEEPLPYGDAMLSTPGRVGVAIGTTGELRALLTNATIASRRACLHVRPGYVVHDEAYRRQREKARRIELALPQAIERREPYMVYQPVADGHSGEVLAFEALMRWRTAGGEFISPADFIAIAEETGHILALGEMALRAACSTFVRSDVAKAFPQAQVSVNLSPRQLMESDLVSTVRQVLATTGLPAQRLALEITESAFMEDPDVCIERITALRAMGVAIYLDDFGTGYSSLSYLTRIPIDVLKIDQSFVRGRTEHTVNKRIVSAMVQLTRSMGITPLAEGVETDRERQWLLEMGCVRHQGYLYARPAPIEDHLAAHQARRATDSGARLV
ncbi:MAG: putative bifunctional diguanylate cyclase/phosphodiesterase [Aquincola tertiaricarbonis]